MNKNKGFTVLELTVVVAMIGILLALVLVGLNAIRQRADDDRKIGQVNDVAVALEDFRNECRSYPEALVDTTECAENPDLTFANFYPNIASLAFNTPESPYRYQPLSFRPDGPCTGYHLSVELSMENNAFAARDSNFNSTTLPAGMYPCKGDTAGAFDGALKVDGTSVYDIKR